jgi:hypothetical protein
MLTISTQIRSIQIQLQSMLQFAEQNEPAEGNENAEENEARKGAKPLKRKLKIFAFVLFSIINVERKNRRAENENENLIYDAR